MGRRLAAYLPDTIYEKLETWAATEGRSLSSLASFLIEKAVRDNEERQERLQRETNAHQGEQQ